jgi:hypothetical protein
MLARIRKSAASSSVRMLASNRDTTRGSGPRRLQLGEPLMEYLLINQSRHRPASSLDVLTDHQC